MALFPGRIAIRPRDEEETVEPSGDLRLDTLRSQAIERLSKPVAGVPEQAVTPRTLQVPKPAQVAQQRREVVLIAAAVERICLLDADLAAPDEFGSLNKPELLEPGGRPSPQ